MLEPMIRRLHSEQSFERVVRRILRDAMALNGAEFGTLQLLDGNFLLMVDQQSFKLPFIRTFRSVVRDEGSACGRALRSGKTVIIEDVELDAEFEPFREVARAAGYRSVVTTPLTTGDRQMVGVVATHFARVHRPTDIEVATFEQYCIAAADSIVRWLSREAVAATARAMNDTLFQRAETAETIT